MPWSQIFPSALMGIRMVPYGSKRSDFTSQMSSCIWQGTSDKSHQKEIAKPKVHSLRSSGMNTALVSQGPQAASAPLSKMRCVDHKKIVSPGEKKPSQWEARGHWILKGKTYLSASTKSSFSHTCEVNQGIKSSAPVTLLWQQYSFDAFMKHWFLWGITKPPHQLRSFSCLVKPSFPILVFQSWTAPSCSPLETQVSPLPSPCSVHLEHGAAFVQLLKWHISCKKTNTIILTTWGMWATFFALILTNHLF